MTNRQNLGRMSKAVKTIRIDVKKGLGVNSAQMRVFKVEPCQEVKEENLCNDMGLSQYLLPS